MLARACCSSVSHIKKLCVRYWFDTNRHWNQDFVARWNPDFVARWNTLVWLPWANILWNRRGLIRVQYRRSWHLCDILHLKSDATFNPWRQHIADTLSPSHTVHWLPPHLIQLIHVHLFTSSGTLVLAFILIFSHRLCIVFALSLHVQPSYLRRPNYLQQHGIIPNVLCSYPLYIHVGRNAPAM